ncbi:recQ-mediated genome instability protein 1-like isoform X2 [Macrobrachium rosenbergii]|uniref:recQ-mediated genome instability protein 1-like isoform X2 n=1 Tax=Macrobrachium rosenbergii TaxID=79674 RepID=UPI0034D4C7AF
MMTLATNVKNFLKSKHISVPDEWIEPCLEFIQMDNPGINMGNTRVIYEKVYEQWLHSDLTELASCCLPFGLVQKRNTMLNGQFVLQVNQIRDIGHPAYVQLQKLRKTEGGNAAVSADKQYQPLWEPKPSRMLFMQMTDGTSVVQGMEYRFIPHLNVNVKPGTKVLVSGAVKCRRGVLLLTRDNITVLGGATESLSITNAVENVLARTLGVEETDEPHELLEIEATQVPQSQMSQYYPSQVNRVPSRSHNLPNVASGQGGGRMASSVNRQQNSPSAPPPPVMDDLDDDFLDSDLEAALNQIESQAGSSLSSSSYNNASSGSKNLHALNSKKTSNNSMMSNKMVNNSVKPGNIRSKESQNQKPLGNSDVDMAICEEFFNDDFDDELLLSAESSVQEKSVQLSSTQPRRTVAGLSSTTVKPSNSFVEVTSSKPIRPPPLFGNQNNFSVTNKATPVRAVAPQKLGKVSPLMSSLSKSSNSLRAKQSCLTNFLTKVPGNQENKVPVNIQNSNILNIDEMENEFAQPFEEEIGMNKKRMKTTEKKDSATHLVTKAPFTYLYFLPENPTQMQEYIVKGFIMTLISKLEVTNGNWRLTAVINDGSASHEVDIDNKILCHFIGMTCSEFQIKKKEARFNPALQQQLSKSVGSCQQKLISLCCLLRLQLFPDFIAAPSPVCRTGDVTPHSLSCILYF